MSVDGIHTSGTRIRAGLACLAVVSAILGCNMQRGTAPDLAGTITAQALTLEARGATAAAPSESPAAAAETSTLTEAPAPTAALAAATSPPQPTKTPKPTKTPEPAPTATSAGPIAPWFNQTQVLSCTATTLNGQPAWITEVKVYWVDNSTDEDYFLLYRSTDLHPEKVLVSAPPPNLAPPPTVSRLTFKFSYLQSSVTDEPLDWFYLAAYNANGTTFAPETQGYQGFARRCTQPCKDPYPAC